MTRGAVDVRRSVVFTLATLWQPSDWELLADVPWSGWLSLAYGIAIATVLVY